MTIQEFIDKWSPIDEPRLRQIFLQDFWQIIDKLGEDRFRQVAIEVLSSIKESELKMYDQSDPWNGVIAWGKRGEVDQLEFIVYYPPEIGQQGSDWFYLLQSIAYKALKNG